MNALCEVKLSTVCGAEFQVHAHHRKMRSQGGRDELVNTIMACSACHQWIHLHPATSYERGWLVRSWQKPEDIPWRRYDDSASI